MAAPPELVSVLEVLAAYDPAGMLATFGGLQLMPANADVTLRLETYARLLASREDASELPTMSQGRLRQLLRDDPMRSTRD